MIFRMRIIGVFLLAIFFPFLGHAAIVNINTADAALLDTLPGIGPSKAAAIIEYRSKNGLFARVEDIQNVSGIGSSTYSDIKPFIAVTDEQVQTTVPVSPPEDSSVSSLSSRAATTYVPPPAALFMDMRGPSSAIREVPMHMAARVTTKSGATDSSASISWSFGDGSFSTGSVVEKTYHYPGTYLVVAKAVDGFAEVQGELLITVTSAKVRISKVSGEGITIVNDAKERLDLSGWRILSDTGTFRIPEGMVLLPESSVLFPFSIINLPIAFDATLLYPNGVVAAQATPKQTLPEVIVSSVSTTSLPQPLVATVSYKEVGTEGRSAQHEEQASVADAKVTIQTHEDVLAPTAAKELAAVGAVVPSTSIATGDESTLSRLFHSPWSFGLLGVIALAGGAFILI